MVKLELTDEEADWMLACLGIVMVVMRLWDNRTSADIASRTLAKLSLARTPADDE